MPALKDLTGQKFGRWTVLSKAPSRNRAVYWLCQCDCGTIKEVKGASLTSGRSSSCGCLHKENAAKVLAKTGENNKRDLIGQRFGKLIVIQESPRRAANGGLYWICQCDCGNVTEIASSRLVGGYITHCGCETIVSRGEQKIKEILTQAEIPFETQKTFTECRFPETSHLARFDFYVDNRYIIEYDGIQHSAISENNGWNTKEKVELTQYHDQIKNTWCKKNNIPIIRIPYLYYDKITLEDLRPETSSFLL